MVCLSPPTKSNPLLHPLLSPFAFLDHEDGGYGWLIISKIPVSVNRFGPAAPRLWAVVRRGVRFFGSFSTSEFGSALLGATSRGLAESDAFGSRP